MGLLHDAMGWSAVCDCGISWSYSLTFYLYKIQLQVIYLSISFDTLYGPAHLILVLTESVTSKGSGNSAHISKLTRACSQSPLV